MQPSLNSKMTEVSSQKCEAGRTHEVFIEKTEEYPDGTVKYIIACKNCKKHFEIEI